MKTDCEVREKESARQWWTSQQRQPRTRASLRSRAGLGVLPGFFPLYLKSPSSRLSALLLRFISWINRSSRPATWGTTLFGLPWNGRPFHHAFRIVSARISLWVIGFFNRIIRREPAEPSLPCLGPIPLFIGSWDYLTVRYANRYELLFRATHPKQVQVARFGSLFAGPFANFPPVTTVEYVLQSGSRVVAVPSMIWKENHLPRRVVRVHHITSFV